MDLEKNNEYFYKIEKDLGISDRLFEILDKKIATNGLVMEEIELIKNGLYISALLGYDILK